MADLEKDPNDEGEKAEETTPSDDAGNGDGGDGTGDVSEPE